jgi:hypothetical protein
MDSRFLCTESRNLRVFEIFQNHSTIRAVRNIDAATLVAVTMSMEYIETLRFGDVIYIAEEHGGCKFSHMWFVLPVRVAPDALDHTNAGFINLERDEVLTFARMRAPVHDGDTVEVPDEVTARLRTRAELEMFMDDLRKLLFVDDVVAMLGVDHPLAVDGRRTLVRWRVH